jgi:hypothetical protein
MKSGEEHKRRKDVFFSRNGECPGLCIGRCTQLFLGQIKKVTVYTSWIREGQYKNQASEKKTGSSIAKGERLVARLVETNTYRDRK